MLRLLFIVLVVIVAIFVLRKRYVFKIIMRQPAPLLRGQIPGRSWPEVSDFIKNLGLPPGSAIIAYPDERRFRLVFSRDIPEPLQQRIRNFLYLGL